VKFIFKLIILLLLVFIASCVPMTQTSQSNLKFQDTSSPSLSGSDAQKSIQAFKTTLYPIVTSMSCVQCHGDAKKYQPYYAISDVDQAWKTILIHAKKVNLEYPETSRIYLRVKVDHHNCLTSATDTECDQEAANILAAINKWKNLVKVQTSTGIKTSPIFFKDTKYSEASVEYGSLLLEAEQDDFPEANVGRFVTDSDGQASGYKYALTPTPDVNPSTKAVRRSEINRGANKCEVTTPAMLTNSTTGPYRVFEEGTHINSGATTPTNLIIKDGNRPFSIAIRTAIIRPDRRMYYAKKLTGWTATGASGVSQLGAVNTFSLTDGNFNVGTLDVSSSGRTKAAIDLSEFAMDKNAYGDTSFKTLPYFADRDNVFLGDGSFINNPSALIPTLSGSIKLKDLFKQPMEDFSTRDILGYFNRQEKENKPNQLRRDVIFKFVKNKIDSYLTTGFKYQGIENMDRDHFYSLYPGLKVNIKACPNNVCSAATQVVEVTSGTDVGGEILSYNNAFDILKVNAAGSGFVSASQAELEAGVAFRRIDLYAHNYVTTDSNKFGDAFDQTFYTYNEGTNDFSLKSTVSFPINIPESPINLKAFYTSTSKVLSRSDLLANFQKTLFPVMRQATCISCHDGSQANLTAHSSANPIVALNELDRRNLINFNVPMKSLRKVVSTTESMIVHNCGDVVACNELQTRIVNAILDWKDANDNSMASNIVQPFKELSDKERTPGMLEYKFKVTRTGFYNIWTKVKAAKNTNINLRVIDSNGVAIVPKSKINTPTNLSSCQTYTFPVDYTSWTWFTPGRSDDLTKVDSLGKLKKDASGNLLNLADNRTYWSLTKDNIYTIQIFESVAQTKVDLIAIDHVANLNDILDFQPDLLARDENNIADYKKRVLSYDISNLLKMPEGSAFFKVEVKTALGGQNYIFRNPRIDSPKASVHVKGIRVFINGASSFNDASWNNIDLVTGNDQIMTYASLLALIPNNPNTDSFQFAFDVIEPTTKVIAEIDPRGSAPSLVEGRKCKALSMFMNTVKPILRNARLMRKDDMGIAQFLNDFPGSGRSDVGSPQIYQCMTCHDNTHPYFKMTTFDFPEILCAQALSRVDFTNYRESLLVRGLDGTGVHPKLHFVEELEYSADKSQVVPYSDTDGARILSGKIKNQVGNATEKYFSKWVANYYFKTYTQADLGLSSTWDSNSDSKKDLARRYMGELKRIEYLKIPDLTKFSFYEAFVHDPLIGENQSEDDNLVTGVFKKDSYNMYQTHLPLLTENADDVNKMPIELDVVKANGKINKSGTQKVFITSLTPDDMNQKLENIKSNYRDIIMKWIAKEDELYKAQNP
jgi:hypothetical protein